MGRVSPPPWWRKSLCGCCLSSPTSITANGHTFVDPPKGAFTARKVLSGRNCSGLPASRDGKSIIRGILKRCHLPFKTFSVFFPHRLLTSIGTHLSANGKILFQLFNSSMVWERPVFWLSSFLKSCFPFKRAGQVIISKCVATDKGQSPFCLLDCSLLPRCYIIGMQRRPRELAVAGQIQPDA